MNNQRKEFCREYVKNGSNGTQAYLKAYPKSKSDTARKKASHLLTIVDIKEYIEQLQQKAENKAIMSIQARQEYLTKIITGEELDRYYTMAGPIDAEANLTTKMKALDILNKMTGQYVTKIEGEVNISYESKLKEVIDENDY